VIRTVARIGWVARRRNKNSANGAAPTAKTAGAFTIANFDNSLRAVYPLARIFLTAARILAGCGSGAESGGSAPPGARVGGCEISAYGARGSRPTSRLRRLRKPARRPWADYAAWQAVLA